MLPQIGAGAGLSTQVVLINQSGLTIGGEILLFASDGTPLQLELDGLPASVFPYQIEPNGAFRGELTLPAGLGVGYAVVTLTQGAVLPAASAIFQFRNGDRVISEAGVAATPLTTAARIFADNAATRTGVAIAVPDQSGLATATATGPSTLVFRLLDRRGIVIETQTRTVPRAGHISIFVDELFPDLPQGFTGQMEISSDVPFAPVTLKLTTNTRGNSILTTLPVGDLTRPPEGTLFAFPQIGFGLGFSTRLILIHTDINNVADGEIRFFQSDGSDLVLPMRQQRDSRFDYEIDAGVNRQLYPGVTAGLGQIIVDQSSLVINEGNTIFLRPITLDQLGNPRDDFELNYQSLSPDTVSVDALGNITGLRLGFSTVTISGEGLVTVVTVAVVGITAGITGWEPTGVALDSAGKLYLANTGTHVILSAPSLEQSPTPYAGIQENPGWRDDLRLNALFNSPSFLTLNQANETLYVSDGANHRIRQVDPGEQGQVRTLAGTGQIGSRDGEVSLARFNNPQGIGLDDQGYLWIADSDNHIIRRINLATDQVETIAGRPGQAGSADGSGGQARFDSPAGLAVATEPLALQLERERTGAPPPPVSVIVADTGNGLVRRVGEDGKVETLGVTDTAASGKGPSPVVAGRGSAPFRFTSPVGVAVDSFGNIYVSESDTGRVKVVLRTGEVELAAQTGTFLRPKGMAITSKGGIVVGEANHSLQRISYAGATIFRVTPDRITTRGGERITLFGQNITPGVLITLGGVPVATQVLDTETLTFVAPPLPSGRQPLILFHPGGLSESIIQVDPISTTDLPPGNITTVVGGTSPVGDNWAATSARLRNPSGITISATGEILVADTGDHRVRKIGGVPGVITTLAGNGVKGFSGDNQLATLVSLADPFTVVLNRNGDLLIADTANHRIRRIDSASGQIRTLAGTGRAGFSGDGRAARNADLNRPRGIAVDSEGNLMDCRYRKPRDPASGRQNGRDRHRRRDAGTHLLG